MKRSDELMEELTVNYNGIGNISKESDSVDIVVAKCTDDLVPDKAAMVEEIKRVLKPGGSFTISDVVWEGIIPDALSEIASIYAVGSDAAISLKEYLYVLQQAGIEGVSVLERKLLPMPEALVKDVLTDVQYRLFHEGQIGIFNITVYGEKPSCCCCS